MSRLTVTAAQTIPTPGDVARNVDDHARLAVVAADRGAQIVELSLTGYDRGLTCADAPLDSQLKPLRLVAEERQILIIAGAPVASPGGLHIGALSFMPNGSPKVYLKQYLHGGEEGSFVPGNRG